MDGDGDDSERRRLLTESKSQFELFSVSFHVLCLFVCLRVFLSLWYCKHLKLALIHLAAHSGLNLKHIFIIDRLCFIFDL